MRQDALREQETSKFAPGAANKQALVSDLPQGAKSLAQGAGKQSAFESKLSSLSSLFLGGGNSNSASESNKEAPSSAGSEAKESFVKVKSEENINPEPPADEVASVQAQLAKLISVLHSQQGVSVAQIAKSLNIQIDNKTAALLNSMRQHLVTADVGNTMNSLSSGSNANVSGILTRDVPSQSSVTSSDFRIGWPDGGDSAMPGVVSPPSMVSEPSSGDQHAGVKAALAKLLAQQGVKLGGNFSVNQGVQQSLVPYPEPLSNPSVLTSLSRSQSAFPSVRVPPTDANITSALGPSRQAEASDNLLTSFSAHSRSFSAVLGSEDSRSSMSSEGLPDSSRSGSHFFDRELSFRGIGISPRDFPERLLPRQDFPESSGGVTRSRGLDSSYPRNLSTGELYHDSPGVKENSDSYHGTRVADLYRGSLTRDSFSGIPTAGDGLDSRDAYSSGPTIGDNRDGYRGGRSSYGW